MDKPTHLYEETIIPEKPQWPCLSPLHAAIFASISWRQSFSPASSWRSTRQRPLAGAGATPRVTGRLTLPVEEGHDPGAAAGTSRVRSKINSQGRDLRRLQARTLILRQQHLQGGPGSSSSSSSREDGGGPGGGAESPILSSFSLMIRMCC